MNTISNQGSVLSVISSTESVLKKSCHNNNGNGAIGDKPVL